ncbi:hypothetical protein ROZALSC1DRAFT_27470 [Rozella allomycis CSF55]|uniref:RRM domain-containing protein n=1 Tax=Rozella allomycis (strain CSF55) TaxID=988480 RepID=A0A075APE6_ROZAC|nr:hypothetical protein O9G_004726 [Rozella allomycis CSF55]RKP21093.1 hypothetical protein ROZALSC1DRAFT_27470 [Rozella allomycis CSF55]|eukprot:EPZ31903.1 hypothetical protein O9G_004726 [Rozella allomycis CSF55]
MQTDTGAPTTTLWMGDIDPWMDENYIRQIFALMGEPKVSARIIRDRATGASAGYCFVDFPTHEICAHMMTHVNGQPMPGGTGKVFRLNWATGSGTNVNTGYYGSATDLSIYVGDLSPDVNDYVLMTFFQQNFKSVRSAKVMTDPTNGVSRGYGYVRFMDEDEYQRAITEMNGQVLCGLCIKVAPASVKRPHAAMAQQPNSWANNVATIFNSLPYALPYWLPYEPNMGVLHMIGVPERVNEEDIRNLLGGYGDICDIKFSYHHHFREAFVIFATRLDVERVLYRVGREVVMGGMNVVINMAPPKITEKIARKVMANPDVKTSNAMFVAEQAYKLRIFDRPIVLPTH